MHAEWHSCSSVDEVRQAFIGDADIELWEVSSPDDARAPEQFSLKDLDDSAKVRCLQALIEASPTHEVGLRPA